MRYTSLRKIMVSAQVQAKKEIRAEFKVVADTVRLALLNVANSEDQPVPYSARDDKAERQIRLTATQAVDRMFLGEDGLPFASDGVTDLAPYPHILNVQFANVTALIVNGHARWLEARVPDDIYEWLSTVPSRPVPIKEMIRAGKSAVREQDNPFLRQEGESVEDHIERLRVLRIFSPNPLAEYDPAHTWVDSKGYRLSDRIWNTAAETRRKLDEIIRDGIRQGMSARDLANLVERFLIPGRAALRTSKPYGTDASYDAMRLARTEIARAANQAAFISAYNNPYVDTYDIARSPNGDLKCPICPEHASINVAQERVRDPYILGDGINAPFHPHCVTPGQLVNTVRGDIPIEEVRVGDYVLTHKGRYREVLNAWAHPYTGLAHKVTTPAGVFELTSNHPVLTSNGWVDTEKLKVEDQVFNASVNIPLNFDLGIAKCNPSQIFEFSVPLPVSSKLFRAEMPTSAITFNGYFIFDNGKINTIPKNREFSFENDPDLRHSLSHRSFNRGRFVICPNLPYFTESYNKSGIMDFLDARNLFSDFWAFSRIIIPSHITEVFIDFTKHLTGHQTTSAIIPVPLSTDTFAFSANLQTAMIHYDAKHTVGDAQLIADGWITEFLRKVKLAQNILNGLIKGALNSIDVIVKDFISGTFPTVGSLTRGSTNGTRLFPAHNNNLLSLSPDNRVGAESGNPVVEQVANLFQAHLYYSRIQHIETRHYEGLVYNMTVHEDESYTVNGTVVHNCMCRFQANVSSDVKGISERLRAMMQDAQAELLDPVLTPVQTEAFIQSLLGDYLISLIIQAA